MKSSNIVQWQDQPQAEQAAEWLRRLPQLPVAELPPLADIEASVRALTEPVDARWCMARVASLLNPYFEKNTPQSVRELEAQDWLDALVEYPQWVIDKAVRWWKGPDNPNRHKRPMEGDIAAFCKAEVGEICAVPKVLAYRKPPEPPRIVTPEDMEHRRKVAAEVMAKFAGGAQ